MKAGQKTILLFVFLATAYVAGLLIFTKGFLLVRTMVHQNNSCEVEFVSRTDDLAHGGHSGCWAHARFKRAIIIVIDALRYDFLVYNTSLKSDPPPYKNKFKTVFALMNRHPKHARLYKFIADPPTTTLQRLKGLTTGSLPTFVDAGANFDSSEITEDNWVDQLISQGKDIKFLGDDTWESLFPRRFYKSFPFPSFNVKDLHTVDNGILRHMYPELRRRDWDVFIAHFLGVDHCGHRFGPNHPAMADKLDQMDQVIRNVTSLMKDDTVLFVFGDHGMTRTGDHGGDSDDELTAGLFVYSPAQMTASSQQPLDKPQVIQQTDLVPTLSLLLGLPIPFSNLGTVIPDLFNHCPWWDTQHNDVRQVFHTVKALHLNALQVSQYLTAYANISMDFPQEKLHYLQNLLRNSETELQTLITGVVTGAGSHGLLDRFFILQDQYQEFLSQVRKMCQDIWAKFDLTAISLGLITVLGTVVFNLVLVVCWTGEQEDIPAYFPFVIGGVVLQIVYYIVHVAVFPPTAPPIMGFVIGLVLVYALIIVLKKKVDEVWKELTWNQCIDCGFAALMMVLYFAAFFSNSFVVYEDSLTHFLAQSLLWYTAVRVMLNCWQQPAQGSQDFAGRFSKKTKSPTFVDFLEFLTQPAVVTFFLTSLCSVILRFSFYFRACREEQWECQVSSFLQPLSSFAEDATGFKNQRYFFSIACLFVILWLTRRWLQYYGNLNGDGINVLCTKFILPLGGIACALHWAVQALPQKEHDALSPWQQTVMAQVVYICVAIHMLTTILQPLYVYIIDTAQSNTVNIPPLNRGAEYAVPYVYRQLRQHWQKKDESTRPPDAYGLGTVYSSNLVTFATSLFLLLALLLGDGMASSLALAVLVLFVFLELTSAYCAGSKSEEGVLEKPVPWISVIMHGLLSSTFFFATGHQATVPTIRFESAFTGFHGDFSNYFVPTVLITLNTFASPIFFAAISPLLLFWPQLQGPVSQWMVSGACGKEGDRWRGDFGFFDNGILLRKNLFCSSCRVLLFHALKVLAAACAAGLHRRHLMVWKIFAPRFIFEAANLIVVSAVLLLTMLLVLRVDRAVFRLTKTLQKDS